MDGVRLGDVGILYVSPEQLRNRSFVQTISQREWQELDIVRAVFEAEGIDVSLNWGRSAFPRPVSVRMPSCSAFSTITAKSR